MPFWAVWVLIVIGKSDDHRRGKISKRRAGRPSLIDAADSHAALPPALPVPEALRGRLAWAHDYDPDHNVLATFQTLPGANFVVNGATHAADSALTTASVDWKWLKGWSAAATFEGEFSNVTQSYAGKGVVRYAW